MAVTENMNAFLSHSNESTTLDLTEQLGSHHTSKESGDTDCRLAPLDKQLYKVR